MYNYLAPKTFMYFCQIGCTTAAFLHLFCFYFVWNSGENPKFLPIAAALYFVIGVLVIVSLILYTQSILLNILTEDIDFLVMGISGILALINFGVIMHAYSEQITDYFTEPEPRTSKLSQMSDARENLTPANAAKFDYSY